MKNASTQIDPDKKSMKSATSKFNPMVSPLRVKLLSQKEYLGIIIHIHSVYILLTISYLFTSF